MFMEGRRYSPPFVLRRLTAWQDRRLKHIIAKNAQLKAANETTRAKEVNLKKLDYPLDENGLYYAPLPTRLGNLLTAYENYPNTVYKLDPIFYWHRLWLALDKDLRSSLDEAQAVADSGVYVSFALYLSFGIMLLYALGGWIWPLWPFTRLQLQYLPAPIETLGLSLFPLVLGYGIYRVSLFQQRSYGELFKSLFDQYRDKLDEFVDEVAADIRRQGGDRQEILDAKYKVVSRYLRWHRIRRAPPTNTP